MLTKEQIVLLADMAYVRGVQSDHAAAIRAAIDLAGRCLDAQEHRLSNAERARFGACGGCGALHGQQCSHGGLDFAPGWPRCRQARLDAAPKRVRLVPVVP